MLDFPLKELHKMTEAQEVQEMYAARFKLNIDNLTWQHFMIFV